MIGATLDTPRNTLLYQQMPSCIVALLKALQSLGWYTHCSTLMKVNNNYIKRKLFKRFILQ